MNHNKFVRSIAWMFLGTIAGVSLFTVVYLLTPSTPQAWRAFWEFIVFIASFIGMYAVIRWCLIVVGLMSKDDEWMP